MSGYVGRLRRLLGDSDGLVLTTRPPGYQLLVTRDDVDASRFEDLLTAGRRALDGGDVLKADSLLTETLAIWRGPALADVPPGPVVTAEGERLEELRLSAVELQCEAKMPSGRHDGLVPDLLRLTADHPLRERFWHQRLRALNASGRPAEALEAYEQARKILAEELGADPGPDLQQLYLRILSDGPTPAAWSAAGRARFDLPLVPRQLPARVRGFVGRAQALERLWAFLDEAAGDNAAVVISAIAGTAGAGKTALAMHWAHEAAGRFPDGQLYVNLRGSGTAGRPVLPGDAISGFLSDMGVPPDCVPRDLESRAALYRSLLADRRMLVVADDASDDEQVRSLVPASAGCMMLVTSRRPLLGLVSAFGAFPLTVDVLTDAEARELLAHRLGTERLAAEPEAIAELISLSGHLPGALSVASASVSVTPGCRLAALTATMRPAI